MGEQTQGAPVLCAQTEASCLNTDRATECVGNDARKITHISTSTICQNLDPIDIIGLPKHFEFGAISTHCPQPVLNTKLNACIISLDQSCKHLSDSRHVTVKLERMLHTFGTNPANAHSMAGT